jgi:Zn-dependent protease
MVDFTQGMFWFSIFLFSLVVHEAAHALAAHKLGDSTGYDGGQVSLNPLPHIRREPFGTIAVPIVSYILSGWMIGWASTPYDPDWARRYPHRSAWMALAGPSSNLCLVLCAALAIRLGILFDVFHAPDSFTFSHIVAANAAGTWTAVATLLSILFSLNLILFLFNLLPVPPLDGSSIVQLFLSHEQALKYSNFIRSSSMMFFGLIIAWQIFGKLFRPVFLMAINLLYPGSGYYWS